MTTTEPGDSRRPRSRAIPVALGVLIALLAGVLVGRAIDDGQPAAAAPGAVDIGFAQDMAVHHAQAVEMSGTALARSATPEIRTLAYDVATSQQSQIGTIQGWLRIWNRPAIDAEASTRWMGGDHATGGTEQSAAASSMPGMASQDDLRALRSATGTEFDSLYLRLLLRHHEGGLPMAEYARDNAETAMVAEFAGRIAQTQNAESESIRQLLAARGATPLPAVQPHR